MAVSMLGFDFVWLSHVSNIVRIRVQFHVISVISYQCTVLDQYALIFSSNSMI
jgi:hypothetical protein